MVEVDDYIFLPIANYDEKAAFLFLHAIADKRRYSRIDCLFRHVGKVWWSFGLKGEWWPRAQISICAKSLMNWMVARLVLHTVDSAESLSEVCDRCGSICTRLQAR